MIKNGNSTQKAISELAHDLEQLHPKKILAHALEQYEQVAISFSGAEDVVLIDMASKLNLPFRVFTLDTGRMHPETYQLLDKVRNHYNIAIETTFPNADEVSRMVEEKGLFSFFKDGHNECCQIRKVKPLRNKLSTLDAWITGQRKDQSPTRNDVPVAQIDNSFSTPEHTLIKFNPLANWRSEQVWAYIREFAVPYNPLHEQGFISIGCEPCTRPVLPNQHEREGRWWWEEATQKECGLHAVNFKDK